MSTKGGAGDERVPGPAFDNAKLTSARKQARAAWGAESAKERDRLMALSVPARLEALDDDAIRATLTPQHRAELRASIAKLTMGWGSPPPPPDEDHAAAMAAWRKRDAAAQAAKRQREIDKRGWIATGIIVAVEVVVGIVVWFTQ